VGAARSGDFSALSKRFGALDLSVERKRAHVTYTKRLALDLEARLGFSHEHRDGLRATSMSFGADANVAVATYFAQPIDQDNDRLEASLAHVSRRGQWSVHYTGGFFTDHLAGTMVQNPFTGTGLTPFLPAVSYPNGYGFLSSPPSSTAHQLAFDGGMPLFTRARLTTHLGFGLEQQNDPFAGYSINPGLAITTPLPRSTLGGLVFKTLARLSLAANVGDGFDLDASASFDARDNRTPRATYLYLVSDSQIQPNPRLPFNSQNARINAPYSWQKQLAHLALHYRLAPDLKLSLGYDFDDRTRSYQAVRRTTEQTGKLRLFYTFAWGDAALSTAYGHRHAGRYVSNQVFFATRPTLVTTQFNSDVIVDHPLARKYDLADRTRQNIEGHINLDPVAYAGLGLGGTLGRDDYDQSVYGLKRADRNRLDVDLHLRLGAGVKLSGFVALETHRSLQANYYLGGATLSNPDQVWQARNRDTSDIVGAQMDWTTALDGLAVKASVERMWTRSRIDVSAGSFTAASVVAPLPDVTAKSLKLRAHADYQLNADLALRGTYGFDRLAARAWAYMEADPLAYASLLGSGIRAPHYNIHQIGASLRYGF
jgi:MtrB/PioB family decaheme-associated outer membrane protein